MTIGDLPIQWYWKYPMLGETVAEKWWRQKLIGTLAQEARADSVLLDILYRALRIES